MIRLRNSATLILEIKGMDDDQNRRKRESLAEWVDMVNDDGRYGMWTWDVAFHPSEVGGIVDRHARKDVSGGMQAACPGCGMRAASGDVGEMFGFRSVDGMARPQVRCRRCRRRA